jgi:hypothetical protein
MKNLGITQEDVTNIARGFADIREIPIEALKSIYTFDEYYTKIQHSLVMPHIYSNNYGHEINKDFYEKLKKMFEPGSVVIDSYSYLLKILTDAVGAMKHGKMINDFLTAEYSSKIRGDDEIKLIFKKQKKKVFNMIKILRDDANTLEPLLINLSKIDIKLSTYIGLSRDDHINENMLKLINTLLNLQGNALMVKISQQSSLDFLTDFIDNIRKKVDQVNLLMGDKPVIVSSLEKELEKVERDIKFLKQAYEKNKDHSLKTLISRKEEDVKNIKDGIELNRELKRLTDSVLHIDNPNIQTKIINIKNKIKILKKKRLIKYHLFPSDILRARQDDIIMRGKNLEQLEREIKFYGERGVDIEDRKKKFDRLLHEFMEKSGEYDRIDEIQKNILEREKNIKEIEDRPGKIEDIKEKIELKKLQEEEKREQQVGGMNYYSKYLKYKSKYSLEKNRK